MKIIPRTLCVESLEPDLPPYLELWRENHEPESARNSKGDAGITRRLFNMRRRKNVGRS